MFDATGKAAKTHNGVRSEFARVGRAEPRIERSLSTFLAQAYSLKENADYAIGDAAGISLAEAGQAVETATRFVAVIAQLLEVETP